MQIARKYSGFRMGGIMKCSHRTGQFKLELKKDGYFDAAWEET